MIRVLTYGTFDMLHEGHINLLRRAKRRWATHLVVAVSTDEFNAIKAKKAISPMKARKKIVEAVRYVDLVIPEGRPGEQR